MGRPGGTIFASLQLARGRVEGSLAVGGGRSYLLKEGQEPWAGRWGRWERGGHRELGDV